jgi:hypothetical protein
MVAGFGAEEFSAIKFNLAETDWLRIEQTQGFRRFLECLVRQGTYFVAALPIHRI